MKNGGDRMTSDFMKELLSKDEKITVEYKPVSMAFRKMCMKRCVLFLTDMVGISSWVWKMTGRQ